MRQIITAIVLVLFVTSSQAAVKRKISVKNPSVNETGVSFSIEFTTSFNQKFPVECDLIGKKKRTVSARKIGKKKYRVFATGVAPKKIRCYYWLK